MKVSTKYIVILSVLLTFHFSCNAEKITTIDNLQTPDDIAFFNEKGEKCFLDQYEGKTILLVFWATWCSTCVKEIPELDLLQKDFRKLPFEVIAVSQDFQGMNILKDFYKIHEVRYLKIFHDYQNELFKAFAVVGLPTSYLINPEGKIVKSFAGNVKWYEPAIRSILLEHIPGNPETPKNSHKIQDLNQAVKSINLKKNEESSASVKTLESVPLNSESKPQEEKILTQPNENNNDLKNK